MPSRPVAIVSPQVALLNALELSFQYRTYNSDEERLNVSWKAKSNESDEYLKMAYNTCRSMLALYPKALADGQVVATVIVDNGEGGKKVESIVRSISALSADIDEILNASLLFCLEAGSPAALNRLVELLISQTTGADLRLRNLLTVFNAEPDDTKLKVDLFEKILDFSVQTSLFEAAVCPALLRHGLKWIDEWSTISRERRASICYRVAALLVSSSHNKEAAKWRLKGIEMGAKSPNVEVVAEALIDKLNSASPYNFDRLVSLPSIQIVKDHPRILPLYRICLLMIKGQPDDLEKEWTPALDSILNKSTVKTKLLCICIAAIAANALSASREADCLTPVKLTLADLGEKLNCSVSVVEQVAATAISYGMLKGRIDQLESCLYIQSGTFREFGKEQWQEVYDRLTLWKSTVTAIRAAL